MMVVRKRMQFWVKMLVFTGVAFIAASFNGPGSLFAQDQDSELDKPVITSIVVEDDEVVIEVDVPAGVMKITLEYRNRLAKGSWVPRLVERLDGLGGAIQFRIPRSAALEVLRVRADASEPLPAAFYHGKSSFSGQEASDPINGSPVSFRGGVEDSSGPVPAPTAVADGADASASRDVVESDIWSIRDNTLYFFNQNRGLQIIDISNPDEPIITGTLNMPATGEQMYVLDSDHVVLLTRGNCRWSREGMESLVMIVKVTGGFPEVVSTLPLKGVIQESRLVGSALYVASNAYQPIKETLREDIWAWGNLVSSFDLSDPANPVDRDTLFYDGTNNTITATSRYLFVSTPDLSAGSAWWSARSLIQLIDIASPDGKMKALSTVPAAGRVTDKFKIHLNGEILSIISELRNGRNNRILSTRLENFSIADPNEPELIGRVDLAKGEALFATRFDGDKAYIVTFERIDPLWVVDLSDPRNPAIRGELEVPGWSTFIYPMGDQLLSIGIDNTEGWRVAVSLFDVADSTAPSLIKRIPLGVNNSWSEATNDEKAFGVLPEQGMLLVPITSYAPGGSNNGVQIMDFTKDSLKARGIIEHKVRPRRATYHNNRILSVSGQEMITVDATDRDNPEVTAGLELSWNVDQLFVEGEYILEIARRGYWYGDQLPPEIRVVSVDDPETILNRLSLEDRSILGAEVHDGFLYVAQGEQGFYPIPLIEEGDDSENEEAPALPNFILSTFDLSTLPEPELVDQVKVELESPFIGQLQFLKPSPGLLVLADINATGFSPFFGGGIAVDVIDGGFARDIWWGGYSRGIFYTFNISDPMNTQFVSQTSITDESRWWNFSDPFAIDGKIYISHQESVFIPGEDPPAPPEPPLPPLPPETKPESEPAPDPEDDVANPVGSSDEDSDGEVVSSPDKGEPKPEPVEPEPVIIDEPKPPRGIWMTLYYLDVIDFSDPSEPTLRDPVNIPGRLSGVSHEGNVIYTVAPHWDDETLKTDWLEWVDASAYDAVEVHLIDSLQLPQRWPRPMAITGNGSLFLGRVSEDPDNVSGHLEEWVLSEEGSFTKVAEVRRTSAIQDIVVVSEGLLGLSNETQFEIVDIRESGVIQTIGIHPRNGCFYPNLRQADGSADQGLWVPLGIYGILVIDPVQLRPLPPGGN